MDFMASGQCTGLGDADQSKTHQGIGISEYRGVGVTDPWPDNSLAMHLRQQRPWPTSLLIRLENRCILAWFPQGNCRASRRSLFDNWKWADAGVSKFVAAITAQSGY